MTKSLTLATFLLVLFFTNLSPLKAKTGLEVFSIYSGDKQATFFRVSRSICNVFNKHYLSYGYACKAVESKGALSNFYDLADGKADFGVIKPTKQYAEFLGEKIVAPRAKKITIVGNLHNELLTILVSKKANINSLNDLNGKIINTGSKGSSSRIFTEEYFSKFNIKPSQTFNHSASESFKKICNGELDAWVYFIGHPNPNYATTLKNCDVKLLELTKSEISSFIEMNDYFKKGLIKKSFYSALRQNINTIASPTLLAARKNINSEIVELVQDVLKNHREELIKEHSIFEEIYN